jgi:hypothetical protein
MSEQNATIGAGIALDIRRIGRRKPEFFPFHDQSVSGRCLK